MTGSTNNSHPASGRLDRIVGALLLFLAVGAVIGAYGKRAVLFQIAEEYMQLPPRDLLMIPISAMLFFLLWRVLARILFTPLFALVEEREAATAGAQKKAKELFKRAKGLEEVFERQLAAARVELIKEKLMEVGRAKEKSVQIVKAAQQAAERELAEQRSLIAQDMRGLRQELAVRAEQFAQSLVSTLENPRREGEK